MLNLNASKKVLTVLLVSGLTFGAALTLSNICSVPVLAEQFTPVQGKVIYVPSGTIFPATATMEMSSEELQLGQSVCIALSQDFYYNNTLIAPIGSSVNGTVTQIKKAGQSGVNGQLMVKFTNIITPYGQMIPISGKIQTQDGTGLIKGEADLTNQHTKDVTAAAAAGAVAAAAINKSKPVTDKKAAAYGAAAGAGAVAAQAVLDKGVPAKIAAGTVVYIVLDQQITFTPQKH